MSDIGDDFKALREANSKKKKANLHYSTELLISKKIEFESKNYGVHLIVTGSDGLIDFWPSTGKFKVRGGRTGRGVVNLIKLCNT